MAKTNVGIALELFRLGAIEFRLRHNLVLSLNIFDEMQIANDFRLRHILYNVLKGLRGEAIEFRLRHNLELSYNNFDEVQLNFA